jgi:GWxTD domain-containing protein
MRHRRALLIAALAWAAAGCMGPPPPPVEENAPFQMARQRLGEGNPEEAVALLEAAVRLDPRLGEAHALLGDLYLERGTIEGRRLSVTAWERAVELAPDRKEYHLGLATARHRQGFWRYGRAAAERALEIDPDYWEAHAELGRAWEDKALESLSPGNWEEAAEAYARATSVRPDGPGLQLRLARALLVLGRGDEALPAAAEAARLDPDQAEAHLTLGAALMDAERFDDAERSFERGVALLPPEEAGPFVDPAWAMTPEEHDAWLASAPTERDRILHRVWAGLDPTPATPTNERRLEHYRRVVLAGVAFRVPKLDVPGWATRRGDVFIRFGAPLEERRALFDYPPVLVWHYDFADFVFVDTFLNGAWSFPFTVSPEGGEATLIVAAREGPETYAWAPSAGELDHDFEPVQLRGDDGFTRVEGLWSIPAAQIELAPAGYDLAGRLDRSFVVYDSDRNEVDRADLHIRTRRPRGRPPGAGVTIEDRAAVLLLPGRYEFAYALTDSVSERFGQGRGTISVEAFPAGRLKLSHLLVARSVEAVEAVEPGEADRLTHAGYRIRPNPSHRVRVGENLALYYEVYGLSTDEEGLARMLVDYEIVGVPAEARGIDSVVQALAGLFRSDDAEAGHIRSSFEIADFGESSRQPLTVNLTALPEGEYRLELVVTDLATGRSATRQTRFSHVP